MTQRVIYNLSKKTESEIEDSLNPEPITVREFIAKWGFGDDKERNKQLLDDLKNVIENEPLRHP